MFVFGLFFAFSVGCDTCANCRDGRDIVIEIIKFRCQRFADGDEAKIVRFASWQRRVWLPCLFRRQSKHATSDLLSMILTIMFEGHITHIALCIIVYLKYIILLICYPDVLVRTDVW